MKTLIPTVNIAPAEGGKLVENDNGKAMGRPVANDVGNVIWQASKVKQISSLKDPV
ncbi:hypothetical protein [Pseudomonas japonica]|uniref:hypothetical protein n=1 Tax=Pseudomonas japonica TaxID=256466 RepID=UPI000A92BDD9|nr:hypothetical protein [Pseudomonas japonica]